MPAIKKHIKNIENTICCIKEIDSGCEQQEASLKFIRLLQYKLNMI